MLSKVRQHVAVMASSRPALFLSALVARLDTALCTLTRPGPINLEVPGHIFPGIDCNDIKKTVF